MGKGSVLGQDPLGWMKVTSENKKSLPLEGVNAGAQHVEKNDQQTSPHATVKQQAPLLTNNGGTPDMPKVLQSSDKVDSVLENNTTTKPKVVIGRVYEKVSLEKAKSVQRNEGVFQETRQHTEASLPGSRTVQLIKRAEPEINRAPIAATASQFSNYIIIAYTALVLILGYFVYHDLSKRTSRIEARIFAMEKAMRR